jgi:hypothetical protein
MLLCQRFVLFVSSHPLIATLATNKRVTWTTAWSLHPHASCRSRGGCEKHADTLLTVDMPALQRTLPSMPRGSSPSGVGDGGCFGAGRNLGGGGRSGSRMASRVEASTGTAQTMRRRRLPPQSNALASHSAISSARTRLSPSHSRIATEHMVAT